MERESPVGAWATMSLRPAVFLDRDGVLTVPEFRDGRSYAPLSLERFVLYPGAGPALQRLKAAGYALVVITNQPDVGNGALNADDLAAMHENLATTLRVDAIETCTHDREDGCRRRKPAPGMLLDSAARLDIDLDRSFIVGDRASDVEAGEAVGCRTVFVDLGYTSEAPPAGPDHVCSGIEEAADWILNQPNTLSGNTG